MTEEELEEARARIREIYDVDSQSAVREELDAEKGEKQYTADDMLVEYDPFGTNTQSLYVYFQTETPVSVSCTVHVEDEDILDYTQQLTEDGSYLLEHEYQVIGLVPDMENEITFTLAETDGQTEEQTITYEMGSLLGQEAVQLETEEGDNGEDVIVRLDVSDGTVEEVLDLGDLFGSYKEACVENSDGELDWIHINTIQWMGDGRYSSAPGRPPPSSRWRTSTARLPWTI